MEKPIKHLHFELLEYLANEGIGVDTNIKNLCSQYVSKSRKEEILMDALDAFSKSWSRVISVLESLKKSDYIKYSSEHGDLGQLYIVGGNFSAAITKEGLDYYYIHMLRGATLKSLKNQGIYNTIAIIVAISSLIGTIGMGIYSTTQNTDLTQRLRVLEQAERLPKAQQHLPVATHKTVDTTTKTKQMER